MQKKKIILTLSFSVLAVFLVSCKTLEKRVISRQISMTKKYKDHSNMDGHDISSFCNKNIQLAEHYKNELALNRDPYSTLQTYNNVLIHISNAKSKAGLLSNVHPDEKVRKEAEKCEQQVAKFITDLSLDKRVYEILEKIDQSYLDEKARRMLAHTLRDFKRSGVDKDDTTRAKIKALNEELVVLGQQFGENIRNDRFVIEVDSPSSLEGLSEDYIKSHKPGPNGKISISTDYPDYFPFMSYAKNDSLRKELFLKFQNRGEKNGPILQSIISKRDELAKLLGYASYANYATEDKMIRNADSVQNFIDKISFLAQDGAKKEYDELLNYKKNLNKDALDIRGYETAFLEEAYKKEHLGFDSQKAREYFPYEQVKNGVINVTSELFGIKFVPLSTAKVWHESVDAYDIFDGENKLGRIYLDMHPREGKFKHAAMFDVVSGISNVQYPEATLVCNFPKASEHDPHALMEHSQVVTFFHEFGHLLHHIFAGNHEWLPFSGVATEWDFVEAPSQLFEEWARDHKVLSTFAKHYKTAEPISAEMVKKMNESEEFGKALHVRRQMFLAALSLNYYNLDPASFDLLNLLKTLQSKYSFIPYEDGTNFYKSFGHLDGYSSNYYTYMWSLSLAKDMFQPFAANDIMNKETALKYKENVLKPGGSKDAADLVQNFLGRSFSFDSFKNWLVKNDATFSLRQ